MTTWSHYCWVDRGGVDLKLAQGFLHVTSAARIEPQTPSSRVQRLNHSATRCNFWIQQLGRPYERITIIQTWWNQCMYYLSHGIICCWYSSVESDHFYTLDTCLVISEWLSNITPRLRQEGDEATTVFPILIL